jgi:hypothetical protein
VGENASSDIFTMEKKNVNINSRKKIAPSVVYNPCPKMYGKMMNKPTCASTFIPA